MTPEEFQALFMNAMGDPLGQYQRANQRRQRAGPAPENQFDPRARRRHHTRGWDRQQWAAAAASPKGLIRMAAIARDDFEPHARRRDGGADHVARHTYHVAWDPDDVKLRLLREAPREHVVDEHNLEVLGHLAVVRRSPVWEYVPTRVQVVASEYNPAYDPGPQRRLGEPVYVFQFTPTEA